MYCPYCMCDHQMVAYSYSSKEYSYTRYFCDMQPDMQMRFVAEYPPEPEESKRRRYEEEHILQNKLRYIRHRANKYELDTYDACCKLITLGEQKIIFGTVGLANIKKKYDNHQIIDMVKEYLEKRGDI